MNVRASFISLCLLRNHLPIRHFVSLAEVKSAVIAGVNEVA